MKIHESTGRTVEEAINAGLKILDMSISDVNVDILDEGSKGLFGLFGTRLARVRLTVKQDDDLKDETRALFADALDIPAPKTQERPAETKQKPVQVRPAAEPKKKVAQVRSEQPKAAPQNNPTKPKPARKAETAAPAQAPEAKKEPRRAPARETVKEGSRSDERTEAIKPATPAEYEAAQSRAEAFLMQLTSLMGVDVTVESETDESGVVRLNIQDDALGILIGRRGETLDAIQYLTGLQVNKGQETYIRVTLDSEGYRAKREDALIRLANRMANRAKKTGRRVSLEPMNPYERRILHSALQKTEGISTHSEGDEPNRHVVITVEKGYRAEGSERRVPSRGERRPAAAFIADQDEQEDSSEASDAATE